MKQAMRDGSKRLILIGGGHAHLRLLHRIPELVARNVEVTVLDGRPELWYSGMMPAVLGGMVTMEAARIPIREIATRHGATFFQQQATHIDHRRRTVETDGGEYAWDVASIAVGSRVVPPIPVSPEAEVMSAKPVARLPELLSATVRRLEATSTQSVRVVFIGGGASAVELSGNLARGIRKRDPHWGERLDLTIVTRGASLIPRMPAAAQQICYDSLTARGVRVLSDSTPRYVSSSAVDLEGGPSVPTDITVFCTGLSAPSVIATSGLPHGNHGELVVRDTLRTADAPIYGGGDCIGIDGIELERIGVHAVRQSGILEYNVLQELAGASPATLQRYVPPPAPLLILNLGDGTGVVVKGRRVIHGRLPYRVKERIDWAFVRSGGTRIRPALHGPPRPGNVLGRGHTSRRGNVG